MNENRGLMTSGSVARLILSFAVPLLLGNLFQQLYNAVDSAVVGHYVGNQALAAVGSSASVINLVVNLFMGGRSAAASLCPSITGPGESRSFTMRSIRSWRFPCWPVW